MKLPIYAMAALTCATLATSCSSDEPLAGGKDGAVTFTVNLPGQIASRAFGKGQAADNLKCLVYEVNGSATKYVMSVDGDGTFSTDAKPTTTVTLQLAKGTAYKVIFWGYNPSQTDFDPQSASKAYNWTTSTGNLSVNYAAMTDWSENYDAFIKVVDVPDSGATDTNVELTRPFAQLNIGTDDLTAGTVQSKYDNGDTSNPAVEVYTTLGVKGLLNAWNPLTNATNSVGDVYTNFGPAVQPTSETFPVTTGNYSYLAMNYLLVGDANTQQVNHDVQLTFGNAANNAGVSGTTTIPTVPFQTNYQTNIFGSLLTNASKFSVTINPVFGTPDNDVDMDPWRRFVAAVNGNGKDAIVPAGQIYNIHEALPSDNEANDLNIIVRGTLTTDTDHPLHIATGKTLNITMEGNGKISVPNNGIYAERGATVSITGGNFEVNPAQAEINGCYGLDGYGNLTLKNVNFVGTNAIAVKRQGVSMQLSDINVDGCTFKMTSTSTTDINSQDFGKYMAEAIDLNSVKGTISNTNIEVTGTGYGITFAGGVTPTSVVTLDNCTVKVPDYCAVSTQASQVVKIANGEYWGANYPILNRDMTLMLAQPYNNTTNPNFVITGGKFSGKGSYVTGFDSSTYQPIVETITPAQGYVWKALTPAQNGLNWEVVPAGN